MAKIRGGIEEDDMTRYLCNTLLATGAIDRFSYVKANWRTWEMTITLTKSSFFYLEMDPAWQKFEYDQFFSHTKKILLLINHMQHTSSNLFNISNLYTYSFPADQAAKTLTCNQKENIR